MQAWRSQRSEQLSDSDKLESLTQKQRDVLDLLIQFKTSKEISRILDISPHTVDQRVEAAKTKLGATSRSDLALIYRELLDTPPIYERLTYGDSPVAATADEPHQETGVGTAALAPPDEPEPSNEVVPVQYEEDELRVVPELFDGRWGTLARLATILAITALLSIAFLGGLSIFVQMSNLVAG